MALRYIWKQPIHCISILSYSVNCIWTTREDIVRFRFCRLTRWIRDKTKDQVSQRMMKYSIVFVLLLLCMSLSSSLSLHKCYQQPACSPGFPDGSKQSGFTYNTGWSNSEASLNTCCQICPPGGKSTTCFDKTDEQWVPQFCDSIERGFDSTLTHLPGSSCFDTKSTLSSSVNKSSSVFGTKQPKTTGTRLSIHGLWPNYWHGFPHCCNVQPGQSPPLVPSEVETWSIWSDLQEQWRDPTFSDASCSVCSTLNHEWQKHGGCYSPGDPIKYFSDALAIATMIQPMTDKMNAMHGQTVPLSFLQGMYPKAIDAVCDPRSFTTTADGKSAALIEVRTCWSNDGIPMDCVLSRAGQFSAPCPRNIILSE